MWGCALRLRRLKQALVARAGAPLGRDLRAASHSHRMGVAKRSSSPLASAPGPPLTRRMCCDSRAPGSPGYRGAHQRYAGAACAAAPRESTTEDAQEVMDSEERVSGAGAGAPDLAMAGAEGGVCGQLEGRLEEEGSDGRCGGGGPKDGSEATTRGDGNGGLEPASCGHGSRGENGGEDGGENGGAQAGPRSPTEGIAPQPLTPDLARWVGCLGRWSICGNVLLLRVGTRCVSCLTTHAQPV